MRVQFAKGVKENGCEKLDISEEKVASTRSANRKMFNLVGQPSEVTSQDTYKDTYKVAN